jgi:type I restriction enzyme, S subunit
MQQYATKTIEEISDCIIDYRGKTPPKATHGVVLVTAKVIKDGFIQEGNHEYITDETYEWWMRRGFPRQWDILITTEAPLGEVAQIRTSDKIALAQRVILLRGNPAIVDQQYFFQAIKSPIVQAGLQQRSSGTTVTGIKQSELRQVKIPLYPLPTQRKIASILSAYDDLIENNTRRIEILEEMARSLYREWFVNFRFPGHEKIRMVRSESGQIPEGWRVEQLETVVEEFIDYRGKTPKKLGTDWSESGIRALSALNVKQGRLINLDKAKFVTEELYQRWMKTELQAGDILMTSEAPLGEVYFLPETRRYCLSQRVFSIRSNQRMMLPSLLFFALSSPEGQEQLKLRASGTTVLGIRQAELRRIPVIQPPAALQERGDSILRPFLMMIDLLQQKCDVLSHMRNFLLPKLMSGEIDVSRFAEKDIEVTA